MYENLFLLILALIWLFVASISDLRKREVPNWLSFSLIIFALAYRVFFAVFNSDLWFFLYGLIGLILFIILAYGFYYARVFAGGDAKLLMGLGAILPFASSLIGNLIFLGVFILLFLFVGGIYGLIYSLVLVSGNKEKFALEFIKQFKLNKRIFYISLVFVFLSLIFVFYFKELIFVFFPVIFLAFPLLFVYGKAVEESCMIVSISSKEVTIGDWLYEEVVINVGRKKKKIKPYWEGLSEGEVELIRKSKKKVKIKQGIPFVPSFLIAFVMLIIFKNNLLNFINFFG